MEKEVTEKKEKNITLKIGLNPGDKRGESKNNPALQQQANDILSLIAKTKK